MVTKKEILKAVEENRLYDFVANEYYRMDKSDLVDLVKELTFAIHVFGRTHTYADVYIIEELVENLTEQWEDEIAEEEEFEEKWED